MNVLRKLGLLSLPLGVFGGSVFAAQVGAQQPASQGKFDGPAELPRVYVKSALVDTPAPGKTTLIRGGENLQTALNQATCGATLKLEAGARFPGNLRLPKKPCDDAHWI